MKKNTFAQAVSIIEQIEMETDFLNELKRAKKELEKTETEYFGLNEYTQIKISIDLSDFTPRIRKSALMRLIDAEIKFVEKRLESLNEQFEAL